MPEKYVVWEIIASDEYALERKLNEFASEGLRVVSVACLSAADAGLRIQDRYMVVLERSEEKGGDVK